VAVEGAREETGLSRGLHLRRKGCASGDAPPATRERTRTHVRTHARTHAFANVMNVKLNDAPPRSREPGDCVCFIQQVLITMPRYRPRPNIALSTLCFEASRRASGRWLLTDARRNAARFFSIRSRRQQSTRGSHCIDDKSSATDYHRHHA